MGALGVSDYALFSLVVTLPVLLLPIGDLGIGAALIDAVEGSKGSPGGREHIERTITSGARALTCTGVLIIIGALVVVATGAQSSLLGAASAPGAGASIATVAALMGCVVPLSLGYSALDALRRSHVSALLQAAGNVLALCLVLLFAALGSPVYCFVSAGFLGHCVAALIGLLMAGRALEMPLLRTVVTSLHPRQRVTRIVHLAGPKTVINVATAVAYGSDRLVLSHTAGPIAVAVYSAGAQLYTPAWALVNAGTVPLWNMFVRQRRDSDRVPKAELGRIMLWFGTGALLVGVGLVTLGPSVTRWMTHGGAGAGSALMAAFAALLLAHAVVSPVAMWLTQPAALRLLAGRYVRMAVVSLALSVPLAWLIGPAGPVVASVASHTVCVSIPCFRSVFRGVRARQETR
ncbi:lipopolysaccharide biosynthesis protein [Streptomyces sp. NPDC101165]|uniref:lipopolysaccharide biosynthesis protein n=1 Tax=Streptomyces sp. NPDC101165 TaxID=3366119 RepID=UPI00381091B6